MLLSSRNILFVK